MNVKLLKRKECLCLTWFSKIIILLSLLSGLYYVMFQLPLTLSKGKPVKKGFLVIDGNLPDYALEESVRIFQNNHYQQIITTGGNFHSGHYVSGKKSMPELTRATLIELGFDPNKIIVLECGFVYRNRTQTSAKKLKDWLSLNSIPVKNIDVFTVGCHAKRSQKLFQNALGEDYNVGVWSVNDRTYDIRKWWKTSKGTRTVINETIAYFYTTLFLTD